MVCDSARDWLIFSYEPTDDGKVDQLFVSKSYDATSHFESATQDVVECMNIGIQCQAGP